MPQASFGMILREARERKGLDIQSVSRRLRVRPDILRALEESDFSSLPARGYTRNMVAAYSRLVGLNPSDITDMYLDQMYSHQVRLSRKEADSPAHVSGRRSVAHDEGRSRRSRRERDEAYPDEDSRARRQSSQRRSRGDESMRPSRDTRNSRRGQEQGSSRSSRNSRGSARASSRRQPERGGLQDTLAVRAARAEGRSRRVGDSTSMNHLGNLYSGMASVAQGRSPRMLVGIVAAVILILLVIIFALMFGNHGSTQSQEITKVPITGVTDTSNSESSTSDGNSSSQSQSTQVKVPTSVSVEYKLASGQQAYVVIDQDGTSTEQMLTGPVDETVDVSGTWSLSTYVTDAFTITMGGKAVEFETDTTSGMPTATVSFSDYLKSWAEEHPDVKVDTSSSTSSSSDSATSSGTSGSASSNSSTTSSSSGSTSSSTTGSSGTTSSVSGGATSSTGGGTVSASA